MNDYLVFLIIACAVFLNTINDLRQDYKIETLETRIEAGCKP